MMADGSEWTNSILEIAYERVLESDEHAELVLLVEGYLNEAVAAGIEADTAKAQLKNEVLDIAPIIEPFQRVLKRVLRSQVRG